MITLRFSLEANRYDWDFRYQCAVMNNDGRSGGAEDYISHRTYGIRTGTPRGRGHQDGTVPMELDAVLPRKPKGKRKRSADKKKGTARYACGKKGHYARVIGTSAGRPRTPYLGSTREAKTSNAQGCNTRADSAMTADAAERLESLDAEDTTNQITDKLERAWDSDTLEEQSISEVSTNKRIDKRGETRKPQLNRLLRRRKSYTPFGEGRIRMVC